MERVRLPGSEVVIFIRQLHVLLASGVPVHRALEVLAEQSGHPQASEVFFTLQRLVLEGRYLSAAVARFPNTFTPMMVGLVRVGEQTGALVESSRMLAEWLERDLEVRQKLRAAMIYPSLVMFLAGFAVLALMNVLGPIFMQIFAERGGPLPWPTQVVLTLVSWQRSSAFWLISAVILIVTWRTFTAWSLNPHWRVWVWERASQLPALGALLISSAWSRYCAALAILLRCGLPPQKAYRFAAEVSGDPRLVVDNDLLIAAVLQGKGVSEYMQDKPSLYPQVVSSSLQAAEDSGQYAPILGYLHRFYREDMEMRLQVLQSLLEPVLLLVTALVLLFLIFSLMWPLYGQLQEVG